MSIGSSGSDSLFDAQGSDRMLAGGGDDRIVVRDRAGDDVIDCGPGTDMVIADPGDRIAGTGGASSGAAKQLDVSRRCVYPRPHAEGLHVRACLQLGSHAAT